MPKPPVTVPVSLASCSIGLPRHTLHQKLEALVHAGFAGIELAFPDLLAYARQHLGRDDVAEDDYPALCEAGRHVRGLCERHNMQIIVLQPFANFEGWPEGDPRREEAFARARGWIDVMAAVGTDMLQVGSSDAEGVAADPDALAADLARLADLLAARGFRLAYENWCWATRAPTWRAAWDLVRRAGRPNVGLCLDTFQTAGGEWGDPTTASGRIEDVRAAELAARYATSLAGLAREVPGDRIFFLQISDAYRAAPPLDPAPDPESGLRARGRWSHDCRPLPYDGGYLPIAGFVAAVLATGFRGWFSVEVFDGRFEEKYGDDLAGFANKAMGAHKRLLGEAAADVVGA